MYSVGVCLTQEPLCGGLVRHHVSVDLRQAGEERSGLGCLTEAPQHTSWHDSVQLVSLNTGAPTLCLH